MLKNKMWGSLRYTVADAATMFFTGRKIVWVTPISNLVLSRIYYSNSIKNEENIPIVPKTFQAKEINVTEELRTHKKKGTKSLKYVISLLGISATIFGTYLLLEMNKPIVADTEMPLWKLYLKNIVNQIESLTIFIQEPSREKLLPEPLSYPYYQPPYTLVLEFTDVLAHPDWTYNTGWRFKKRPGLDYMLENLVGLYEIVVFTAEPGMTIFPVIESLDQKNLVSYKLVRDSTHFVDGHHVKNLDRLNRDLKKVVVVDWNAESIKFHPDNHLHIPRWKGENDDLALVDLTAFLKTIANTEIEDVRDVLRFYKKFDNPLAEFRNKQREYYEKTDQPIEKPMQQSLKTVFDYIM